MATLTMTETDGVTLLRVEGGLTHDGVVPVGQAIEAATRVAPGQRNAPPKPVRMVMDLSDVEVMTTPGLSLLLMTARRVEKTGGRMVLTGTRGRVYDLLRRCRLDGVLNIVHDADEAVRKARE